MRAYYLQCTTSIVQDAPPVEGVRSIEYIRVAVSRLPERGYLHMFAK